MDEVSRTIINIVICETIEGKQFKIMNIFQVDIDNVEDLNELEARLYAQIHHEATDVPIDEYTEKIQASDNQQVQDATNSSNNNTDIGPNYETSVYTNKVLSRRYWSSGENALPQRAHHYQQNNKHRLIRNPSKTSDQVNPQEKNDSTPSTLNKPENQTQLSKQMQIETAGDNETLITNENCKTKQDNTRNINTGKCAICLISWGNLLIVHQTHGANIVV